MMQVVPYRDSFRVELPDGHYLVLTEAQALALFRNLRGALSPFEIAPIRAAVPGAWDHLGNAYMRHIDRDAAL